MMDLRLAGRNLLRHKNRSLVSLCAIIFGEVAILLSGGFIEWNLYAMRTATIYSLLGHIQIAQPKYFTEGIADPFAFLLPAELPALGDRPGRRLELVTPRLKFSGLISRGETTLSFLGEGVDPEREERKNRLIKNSEISRFITVSTGKELSKDDPKGILLGEGLATNLGVNIGDPIVLLVSTASGGLNAVEAKVRGLFFTLSKAYNDVALRLPIGLARELLRVAGSHSWVAILENTEQTDQAVADLRGSLAKTQLKLEVKPWHELSDFYNKTARLYSSQMGVLNFIIGLIVILSIANIMTMNVLERTGEIGTLMAMGTRRRGVLHLFVNEGIALGLVGGFSGLLLGLLFAYVISLIGIPMPPAPGMSHGFIAELMVTPGLAAKSVLTTFGAVLIASVYPAWKASRLNIVDALRHNK